MRLHVSINTDGLMLSGELAEDYEAITDVLEGYEPGRVAFALTDGRVVIPPASAVITLKEVWNG